jgi:hypothetical protein
MGLSCPIFADTDNDKDKSMPGRPKYDLITVDNVAAFALMGTSGIPKPVDGQLVRTHGYVYGFDC